MQRMKRKREEEKRSEIESAIDELSLFIEFIHRDVDNDLEAAHIPTKSFLHICNLVLQVLDKIGPTMAVLRQDINQNIQRLEKLMESDPSKYSNMVEILKKEFNEGNAKKGPSCSKAIVWLTRSLDFTTNLLQSLAKNPVQNMEQAVEESYSITLKPWHGWISSAAFKVALKLVPDTETILKNLMAKGESKDELRENMQTLISLLLPLLDEVHSLLILYSLDRLKCT